MTRAMESLAGGNKAIEIPGQQRRDEVGLMAKTVQVFKESMIRADELAAEQEELKRKAEIDKKAMLNKMADAFEASVKGVVESVSSAATKTPIAWRTESTPPGMALANLPRGALSGCTAFLPIWVS